MRTIDNATFVQQWRKQRHDFLNNLQVIMGFLQLGRSQEAMDYARGVADRLRHAGELAKTGDADLQAALIQMIDEAWDLGLDFQVVVKGEWGQAPDKPWEEITRFLWRMARPALDRYAGAEEGVIFSYEAAGGDCTVSTRWSEEWDETREADAWLVGDFLPTVREELAQAARRWGGEGTVSFDEGMVTLGIRWTPKGKE